MALADIEIPSPEADALVRRSIDGDTEAFARLFEITLPAVFRFLYARCGDVALAEDLAQDSYVRAMRAIGTRFKGGSSDFVSWVMRIARNRFLDHVKSGRMRWEVAVDELPVTQSSADPESDALGSLEAAGLRRALERLTEEQQEIVQLRFLQDLSIAEVATVTGRTEGAVKALQFRALRALQKIVAAEQERR